MKLLAIRFARFGDIVLLLPALSRLKSVLPGLHLTFLTGHRCAPLAEMCPAIDEVISIDRIAMRDGPWLPAVRDMSRLVRNVRRRRFDFVLDCHGLRETSLLTWLSGSKKRLGLKRFDQSYLGFCFNLPPVEEDKSIHVSDVFSRFPDRFEPAAGNSQSTPVPSISIPEGARFWAQQSLPRPPFVVLYIDAPVPERIWPPDRFARVADHVVSRWGADIVVLSGPQGAKLVERLRAQSASGSRLHSFSNLTISQLAAAIGEGSFFVSNDTGPMHLGPALGVQTLGIFSVGIPKHFRPTGPRDGFIQGNPVEAIGEAEVIEKMEEMRKS